MSNQVSAGRRIASEVESWDGVTSGFGTRGEFAFRANGREIGHLHGDTTAHFAFDHAQWQELRDAGRIEEHPIFPGRMGPAARRIMTENDVLDVIALMRLNYDRIRNAGVDG